MLSPTPPPYDVEAWKQESFPVRLRMVATSWAQQGYGTPAPIYLLYVLKIGLYIGGWMFFCSFSSGVDPSAELLQRWMHPDAFKKAILFSVAFEGLGLGCGSGPLTGRYIPPFGGALHFLRPGTTKAPFFARLSEWPLVGTRRSWLDVALYVAHYVCLFRALLAPEVTASLIWPTAVLLPVLGLLDKTIFLSARAEHYYTALLCLLFPVDWIAGNKLVWVAIWWWAATSKLNTHFPAVVCVMISNSPFTRWGPLRRWMYRDFPDDLRPSRLAHVMAHMGTVLEFAFPVLLLLGSGDALTTAGLIVMVVFHVFITSNIPMGVPLEWNFMMVYGAFFLFGTHATISVLEFSSMWLPALLSIPLFVLPLVGNLFPAHVSFLSSMRYYAGNWAYSVWLFRGDASKKLDEHIRKVSPSVRDQLATMYDDTTITAILSKVIAFRAMHLHGRALQILLPKAVDDIDAYEYLDGEIVAGLVLGWNFGDGHLHNLDLLRAVQAQCGYRESELRCIFVESQPMLRPRLAWTIADAATGVLDEGEIDVHALQALQPWPPLDREA